MAAELLRRAWSAGSGLAEGKRRVIVLDSFVSQLYGYKKQGPPSATPASTAITRSWRPPREVGEGSGHRSAQGLGEHQRGILRFLDSLIVLVRGAGYRSEILMT